MTNIENLFKHKFPFNIISSGIDIGEPYINSFVLFYGTETIKIGNSIDVYCIDDLFNKLKPFISYLRSITTETTVRGNRLLESTYSILLRVNDETYNEEQLFFRVINFTLEGGDPNIGFSNIDFHEYKTSYNKYLRSPFEIYVRVLNYYDGLPEEVESGNEYGEHDFESENESEEVESENEYDDHLIPPKPLEESFRIDKCLICLENEPNILFNDCYHICTCFECEKIKPSVKCPYCRTEISRRIKI